MCSARTSVLVLAGPGERPDSCRDSAEHHARRMDIDLRWRDVEAAAELTEAVRTEATRYDAVVLASGLHASSAALADAVRTTSAGEGAPPRVVHVDTDVVDHLDVVHRACDAVLHGRRRRVFHDALAHLRAERKRPPRRIAYGDHPDQVADLRLPDPSTAHSTDPEPAGAPVAVLFHGGFWLDPYERDLMGPLAVALTDAGWATWNVEYRRRGPSGGGWPTTLADACAAVDALAALEDLADLADDGAINLARVVLVGHSAGAQLASYAAARPRLGRDAPGHPPRVTPAGVVSLAGLLDLVAAADDGLGGGAVTALLGAAEDHTERYRIASPLAHLPLRLPLLAVHGAGDTFVPATQTTGYVEVARSAGDRIDAGYPEVHHLDIVAPDGPAFPTLLRWLDSTLRRGER